MCMEAKMVPLNLHPGSVPEWEAESLVRGVLGAPANTANEQELRQLLEEVVLSLPAALFERRLKDYQEKIADVLGEPLAPDFSRYAFYLVQMPLNILVPESKRLARLRLTLKLLTDPVAEDVESKAVAYDLFPPDRWDIRQIAEGQVKLDVTKMLQFVCPAVSDCLGLDLTLPVKWNTRSVRVRTSDRLSNPAVWDVSDESMDQGFNAAVVIRAPRAAKVRIAASLVCEIRQSGLRGYLLAGRFRSEEKTYQLEARDLA